MRDKYYADDRDIVKWAGLLYLCRENKINYILQVAYYRVEKEWGGIYFDDKKESVDISKDIINHFSEIKDIKNIKHLGENTGIEIEIITDIFSKSARNEYHNRVCERIRKINKRKIVFLDPDTGLSLNKPKEQHVSSEEVLEVWQSLNKYDFLVVYQHKPRQTNWIEPIKEEFVTIFTGSTIHYWYAPDISNDVAFFFCQK